MQRTITADWTVNDVIATYPATMPIFGRYRIDLCCGGLKTLREVAVAHQLSLEQLFADLAAVSAPPEVIVDARSDLAKGDDPLDKILTAAGAMKKNQRLVILVGFEPKPLYDVLGKRGFRHESQRTPNGEWRVTFTRTLAGAANGEEKSDVATESTALDVRSVPPRGRHELIFETFAALRPGTAFVLVNDHDPKPLYYQFSAEHSGQFTWEYEERGPEVWRVRIGKVDC